MKGRAGKRERGRAAPKHLEREWGGIERASGLQEDKEGTVRVEVTRRKRSPLRCQQE